MQRDTGAHVYQAEKAMRGLRQKATIGKAKEKGLGRNQTLILGFQHPELTNPVITNLECL